MKKEINFLFLWIMVYCTSGHPLYREGGVYGGFVPPMEPQNPVLCSDLIWENETSGYVYSPNFPGNYPNSTDCYYKIQGTTGSKVALVFYIFQTEPNYDYVTLYDGDETSTNMIAEISGNNTTTAIYRTDLSNTMMIYFHSDEYNTGVGFYAKFIITNDIRENPTGDGCPKEKYGDSFGVFVSPEYPTNYPNNSNCNYLIGNGVENTYIILTVNNFFTEGQYDVLNIYDGPDNSAPLLIQLSGEIFEGSTYMSSGPYLSANFQSDGFTEEMGYSITYQIISKESSAPVVPIEVFSKKIKKIP